MTRSRSSSETRPSGQLDEISEAIGRLSGQVDALDRYTHEREHNIAGLSTKVDGVGALVTREVTRMKTEIQLQIDAMDRRISALEASNNRDTGAKGIVTVILQSPLIAYVVMVAGIVWAALTGRLK